MENLSKSWDIYVKSKWWKIKVVYNNPVSFNATTTMIFSENSKLFGFNDSVIGFRATLIGVAINLNTTQSN